MKYSVKAMIISASMAFVLAGAAHANCVGTDSFKTCTDPQSGNSYTISKFGNTTNMNGFNRRTGSRWSQQSSTLGNSTYHNGYSSDGGRWSVTESQYGNSSYYSGYDSKGNTISKSCYIVNGRKYCN